MKMENITEIVFEFALYMYRYVMYIETGSIT